jgi:hypothetical protein
VAVFQASCSAWGNFDGKTGMRVRNLVHYLMLTEQGWRGSDEEIERD